MNHIRCCASDSGTRSGRRWATSGGRAPSVEAECSARAAIPATVGVSNSARTPSWVSNAALIRDTTWVATSELPPRSKKLSSMPMRSWLSTSAKMPATTCSAWVRGARKPEASAANTGSGKALRSSLPLVLSGKASSTMIEAGTM
ncbi:hypothetical protein FMUAM8_49920 [Nocardia cyriacigeorgica]|nr:hypothetical protein FMUAM8_49920 [Nocardia cyriacigeorgica]BDU08630.1 hypothetical protein FMUBM48_48930 [Nocardia cyriacigeorgica]